jgi:kumamolisin
MTLKRVRKSRSGRAAGKDSGRRGRVANEMTVSQKQEFRQILSGSTRNVAAGAKLIEKTKGATKIDVTVVLVRKTKISHAELQQHLLKTPDERSSVDHTAFAEEYGASDEAIAAVTSFATKYGLNVTNVDQPRRVVKLSGSVASMERAFGCVLHDYAIGQDRYRGRQGPLLLPTEIVAYVEAVLGLDNRPVARPRLRSRAAQISYYPNELAALYRFPLGDGTGQTVALIELGGNYGPDDLHIYFAAAGLGRTPTVQSVSVSPGVPVPYGQDTDSDGEVMLDIEVVGAMAPGATIAVYFAENTDQGFYEAVSQAVHHPSTTAVSISWGSPEKAWTQQSMEAWNSLGESAILLNVPIFVAAGDHGCTDEQPSDPGYDGARHVDFPGSCASVVSCGGTSLRATNGSITSERVWNNGDGWATGGGVSNHFQVPAWQSGLSAEGGAALLMRGVPDVAANADPDTGINVRVNGTNSVSGGTSAAAPQWAALAAVLSQQVGKKVGFFVPLLYRNRKAGPTNDILVGNNTAFGVVGFSAKRDWDACTGLGSPNGAKQLALLSSGTASIVASTSGENLTPAGLTLVRAASVSAPAPISKPFDAEVALLCGQFIEAAYTMYTADPNNLVPAQPSNFPAGYQLTAWVQMHDFIIGSTGPNFYGFIAQSLSDATQFALAIRGTSNGVEWWDDANALLKVPFRGSGSGLVGSGFARIYDTLEVVERPAEAVAVTPMPKTLKAVGGFSQQVSALVTQKAAATAREPGLAPSVSITATGHSLGAALATLYTMDNGRNDQVSNPLLCTFGSPRVGDSAFVASFNNLGLTSWRIANVPDIVPYLPPAFLGFAHIDVLQSFSSIGKVKSSPYCWHSLATYLSLIDTSAMPSPACQLTADGAVRLAATSLSVPAGIGAITITINVSHSD